MVADSNRTVFNFCHGKTLCDDGSCRSTTRECPQVECPFLLPFQCPNGLCVSSEEECKEENGLVGATALRKRLHVNCSSEYPYQCSDGSCVKSLVDCRISTVCPAPFKRCSNGLCVMSKANCPVLLPSFHVAESYSLHDIHIQFIQTDSVSSFLRNHFNQDSELGRNRTSHLCPIEAPFLCATGECVVSSNYCPTLSPCSRELIGNGDNRCSDGSCTNNPRLCPTDNPCPAFSPHMCTDGPYSGQCVPSPEQCLNQAGCPVKRPFRCMDGHCATSKTACGVASMANGCDPNTPYKCVDGSCVESPTECTLLNGCPLLTPYRTRTGLCVENPSKDPFIEENSRQVNCPASKPILCSDGIVRSSLSSRHLRVHAGTVQSVPKLLNLTSQPMQHGRLRLLAPPVPV